MVGNVALLETRFGWLVGWGEVGAEFGEADDLKRWAFRFYFAPIEDETG